jgi:hypothetical protein
MKQEQLLKRCCEHAGGSGTWTTDDLNGFFHQFRPAGKDLAKIYDGVEHGDGVTKRIKAAMKIDGTTKGSMLAVNNPTAVDDNKALALVKKLLTNVRKLAGELGDDELAEMFAASDFVMKSGERNKYRQNNLTLEPHNIMCEVADGIMFGSDSTAAVMFEAVYTLVHNFPLAYYIQWPIYASEFKTKDPFKPFYDLWVRNVEWRFIKGQVVEIYTP